MNKRASFYTGFLWSRFLGGSEKGKNLSLFSKCFITSGHIGPKVGRICAFGNSLSSWLNL